MKMKVVFLLILLSYASSLALSSLPGEIFPLNAEIEVGDSINVTCSMNPNALEGRSSKDLLFVDDVTQVPVAPSDVVIVNETAITYMLRNAKEQQTKLMCKCGNDAIMVAKIYVGYQPLPIEDFNCRSFDFEYMICNFTQPKNPLLTTYNLSYYMDNPEYKYYPHCNYEGKPTIVCNTTIRNSPIYHYVLQASNELGSNLQNFTINNWDIMVPARPGENLHIVNVTTNSLELAWKMLKFDKYRSKGLKWEILLQPKQFHLQNVTDTIWLERSRGEWHLTLEDLPYAWYSYDLHLRVRINVPNSSWSDKLIYNFRTAPCKPNRSPKILPGSFYIDSTETKVKLYWEQLQDYELNGDNFTYVISQVLKDDININLNPIRLEGNSALFSWDRRSKYEFKIRSANHMGVSDEVSSLVINSFNQMRKNIKFFTPRSIHNVYHATNQTYTLSWQPPLQSHKLKDYTVYWCHSKRASQNECRGSIHFENVPRNVTKFVTDHQEYTLNLAVSANYEDFNTGMHWTDCSQDVNSDLVKMDPSVQILNATSLKILWYPEKVCPSILSGYNITYCEVDEDNSNYSYSICLTKPITITVTNHMKKYEIGNLKAHTMYKIEMYMYSALKKGKACDPIVVRTEEAAPSAPRQLTAAHIGNNSVTLEWLPPLEANGIIRSYVIHLNERSVEMKIEEQQDPLQSLSYTWKNLISFTNYRVYVVAKTIQNSNNSNEVNFTTLVGYPSRPIEVRTEKDNASVIVWNRPIMPSGRIDYYEVAVTQYNGERRTNRFISFIGGNHTSCVLRRQPVCFNADSKAIIEVRAVNVASLSNEIDSNDTYYYSTYSSFDNEPYHEYSQNDNDIICDHLNSYNDNQVDEILSQVYFKTIQNSSKYRLLKSQWQGGTFYNCSTTRYSNITIIAILIVGFAIFVMLAVHFLRKKYKKMSNIKCTLPAGLESIFDKDSCNNNGNNLNMINGSLNYSQTDLLTSLDCERGFQSFEDDHAHREEQQHIKQKEDFFMFNEQQKHLLEASLGQDSGFLGDFKSSDLKTTINSNSNSNLIPKKDKSLNNDEYMLMRNGSSLDSMNYDDGGGSSLHSYSDNETSLNETKLNYSVLINNGYTNANDLMKWSPKPLEKPTVVPTKSPANDYLTVDLLLQNAKTPKIPPQTAPLNTTRPIQNSGYIQVSQLQAPSSHNQNVTTAQQQAISAPATPLPKHPPPETKQQSGYTTLAELANSSPNNNVPLNNMAAPQVSSSPHISGYVKQHDLTVFGQTQHQHQQQQAPQTLFEKY